MTAIRVRAEQTTVEWTRGAVFDIERTPYVDRLLTSGGLSIVGEVPDPPSEQEAFGIDPDLPFLPDDGTPPADTEETLDVEESKPARRRRGTKDPTDA